MTMTDTLVMPPGLAFMKPDHLDPWNKERLKITLDNNCQLITILTIWIKFCDNLSEIQKLFFLISNNWLIDWVEHCFQRRKAIDFEEEI